MRLRRLCLAIFAFRLFLREPIQIFQSPQVAIQPSNPLHCNSVSLVSAVIAEIVGRLCQTPTLYSSALLGLAM
jgi:hypothetical protein